MRGVYPGTFDPATVAHIAIATAAVKQGRLDRLDLVVSRVALGKEDVGGLDARVDELRRLAGRHPALDVAVSDHQLLADVAAGYDALVLGADKWAQVVDVAFYGGSPEARDAAVARLPGLLLVAPRPPHPVPDGAVLLDVPAWLAEVSSSAVRAGRSEWRARR